jgi:hypothetical protein
MQYNVEKLGKKYMRNPSRVKSSNCQILICGYVK